MYAEVFVLSEFFPTKPQVTVLLLSDQQLSQYGIHSFGSFQMISIQQVVHVGRHHGNDFFHRLGTRRDDALSAGPRGKRLSMNQQQQTIICSILTLAPPTRTPAPHHPRSAERRGGRGIGPPSEQCNRNCRRAEDLAGATLPLNGIVWSQQ